MHVRVLYLSRNWIQQFTSNAEACSWWKFCCCITMNSHRQPAKAVMSLTNWVLRCWNSTPKTQIRPFNYEIFGLLKNNFLGHWFPMDKYVKEAVHKWMHNQSKTLWICKIMDCCTKCMEKENSKITYLVFPNVHVNTVKKQESL